MNPTAHDGATTSSELRLPASVCPPLPPGWVFLDDWDRLVFHARPSNQGRPTVEVRLSSDDTLRVSATTAREESYERDALIELRKQLVDRTEAISAYLRLRHWLRARLRGETPPPDPRRAPPESFGTSDATRDLWARAMLRLALAEQPGAGVSELLRRAVDLGSPETRALAVTVAILSGDLQPIDALLRDDQVLEQEASWLDAVVGSWMGDFARVDAAMQRWLQGRHTRRVEVAAQLYAEMGCAHTASALALQALNALPTGYPRPGELLSFIDLDEPIAALTERIDTATPEDPVQVSSMAQVLIRRGEFHLARSLYLRGVHACGDSAMLLGELVELLLWAGEFDEAEDPVRRLAPLDPHRAALLEATRRVARGQLSEANRALRSAPRAARSDPRYVLLQAELLVRHGRHRRARRLLTEASGTHGAVAGRILSAMCALRCGQAHRAVTGEEEEHGWIRAAELIALTPEHPAALPSEPDQLYARLQRALDNLRGNRSATPTVAGLGGAPLVIVTPKPDMRQRAVEVLFGILNREPDRVLQDFDDLLARHPSAAHPRCYRGELLLWLGRYDDAERDFIAAREISPLRRWAYVGLSAVALMRGRPEDTLTIAKQCDAICGRNEAATLGVYLGEAYRELGHRRRAIRALDNALAARPSRLGAQINRALVETGREGDRRRDHAWRTVCTTAPGLAAAALADLPDAQVARAAALQACLSRMLGNRSSAIVSYLDVHGHFRARQARAERMIQLTKALHQDCLVDFFKV